jgi:hypothetical protein
MSGVSLRTTFAVCLGMVLIGVGGCGDTQKRSAASTPIAQRRATTSELEVVDDFHGLRGDEDDDEGQSRTMGSNLKGDADIDTDVDSVDETQNGYYDGDDSAVLATGRPATRQELRVLVDVVRRYHRAAAALDGAMACSLTEPHFARAIPEDYGRAPGPRYLRGARTCAAVMSLFFTRERSRFSRARVITGARVRGSDAYVFVGSTTSRPEVVPLKLAGGAWKVTTVAAGQLP